MKKNTSINIRFADEKDAGIILNFLKELAGHHNDADAVTATESRLMKHIKQNTYICLIAEETVGTEKVPLGIALLWTSFSSWRGKEGLHLDDLYVSPKARGKGVGLLLLQRCAKLTIERNYHRLEWIVSNSNTKAIEFYRSVGSIFLGDYITVRFTDDTFKRLENPPPMPKGYEMRRATPDDSEVVYDLICELAQVNNFPADMLQTTPDLVKQCLSGEDSPFEVILVEKVEGTTRTAVGYALYYSSFASWRARETLTIEDLYVAPDHRDKHIGQILLCEAIRIAKERNCTRVDGIVFATNTKVLKKYAKFGAKIMDDWILCRLGGGKLYRFAAGRSKL